MVRNFTLACAALLLGAFGIQAQTTDLIISEYAEGSSSNKYIEIYNGTGATIDLVNYEMWRISNGGTWPESTVSLTGTLADGEVLVIANSSADAAILALPNATTAFNSATFFNGDDAVGLAKDDGSGTFSLIDVVGEDGADPGNGWDVAGTTDGTAEHTLVRKSTVCSPNTDWTASAGTTAANSEWIVEPQNTWTFAGSHTATCSSATAGTTELLISEYAEGSSSNKYIEIYNGTGATIDLVNYEMWRISNGGTWPESTVSLTGTLADGEVLVIANSSADAAILALPNATTAFNSATFFNGDDAVGLAKDDGSGTFSLIDVVGEDGADPGNGWDVAGTTDGTAEHTLVRKSTVCSPNTDWTASAGTTAANSEWIVEPQNTWTFAGSHTTNCAPVTVGDTTSPEVADAVFLSATEVKIAFTEPVTQASVENTANYVVTPGITIASASQIAPDSVLLTMTTALMAGTVYNADFSGVVDTSSNANVLVPFNTDFMFNDYNGSDLVITEIFYNQPNSGDLEYFEVHNKSTSAIELGGLVVSEGVEYEFTQPLSLAAGAYVVMIQDSADFNGVFTVPANQQAEWFSGDLNNGGENIQITNSLNEVVVELEYDDRNPWDERADGDGYSIELCDVNSDPTLGGSWFISSNVSGNDGTQDLFGSPGAANSCASAPLYPIGDITSVDGSGSIDSMDVVCEIQGLVAAPNFSANGEGGPDVEFHIINNDNSEGILAIAFATTNDIGYDPTMGDEVIVRGQVGQFNGVAQFNIQKVEVVSTGNCLPFAQIVDVPLEEYESEIIELRDVTFVDNSWLNPAGDGRNYQVVTAMDDTITVRVRDLTNIDSTFIAGVMSNFNITGLGSEFNGDYQLWPRFQADFDMDVVKPAPADLYINELMSANDTTFADGNGEFDDWIELYNGGTDAVDVAGMYITDDAAEPMKYRISTCDNNTSIPAGGYLIVWADDEEEQGSLHTNFSLSTSGEFVGLYTGDGSTVVDTVTFGAIDQDKSYGRRTDGDAEWVTFEATTPDASNNNGTVLSVVSNNVANNPLSLYPNPVQDEVFFNKTVDIQVFTITGRLVKEVKAINSFNVADFNNGVYLIRTGEGEIVRMIKR